MSDQATHERLWKEHNILDYTFSEIDLRVFRISGCVMRTKWLIAIGTAMSFIWGFLSDLWVLYVKYRDDPDNLLGLGIYGATVVISLTILFFEVKEARLILSTDDVSDCFINKEAYLWKIVTSYDTFCLFKRIGKKNDRHDRLMKMMFFILKNGKRLLLVKIPQFALTLMFIRIETISIISAMGFKILFLSFSMTKLVISLLAYPCIQNFVQEELNIPDFSKFGLSSYVTFLIEKDFNEIIKDQRVGTNRQS